MHAPPCPTAPDPAAPDPAAPDPAAPDPTVLLAWAARVRVCGHAAAAEAQRLTRLLAADGLQGSAGEALADLGRRVAADLQAVARDSAAAADELVAEAGRRATLP